ncbi:aminotransferase class V-fold PLP-dependent enzyme [Actinocrispum wychmicini]|uniref:Selenocysteine lyase/cysteine desulfurase n=1 Tax=Actinocrispum wychmicini TaxID=1213861 RepID=A0A4R2JGQ3_9PSEU|nr:aminotransferase class V-fold PLP-dependent enzyme [Actinocrispum wychmicini]TCO56088.1 selenocysteine lyase/cysteine desulfurase [Actinocrispum wychmicini]
MKAGEFRGLFPTLGQHVHLASCSLGARSVELDAAIRQLLADMAAGPQAWPRFEEQVEQARRRFAALIGADPEQIALMPNASVGAYQIASTMDWVGRPRVLTTTGEFPSITQVWLAQRQRGAEVVHADDGETYLDLLDRRTRLVSVPLVTYQHSYRMPVAELARSAHECGAHVFVDAYQAVGVQPVDVTELDCDFLVAGTMKYLLGMPGVAFLYVRSPDVLDRDPELTGWFGRADPFSFDPRMLDFPRAATRFQTGTPAVPACYAANAGLRLLDAVDLTNVRAHVLDLAELAVERLTGQGERVSAPPAEQRGAHIGLVDPAPAGLTRHLAERDIVVSPRGDVVRVSFHYYNNTEDVAALCDTVGEYRRAGANNNRSRAEW